MSPAHLLFGWHGRANRAKVWLFALLSFVAWTAIVMFAYYLAGAEQIERAGARPDPATVEKLFGNAIGPILLVLLFGLVVFYCGLAVLAKRLHDRNRSAWWLLVFVFGPAFISGFGNALTLEFGAGATAANGLASVFAVIALGVYLWAFVELYCLRGTVGDNRFGPDPLAGRA